VEEGRVKFRSVRGRAPAVSFREALFRGLAPDGSLYVPQTIPRLPQMILAADPERSLTSLGVEILATFIDDIPRPELERIVADAWKFPIRLEPLNDTIHLLELFHGPTLAFKDFGARFMARALSHYLAESDRELSILVATSGDTGSAVASGFHRVPHINVFVLYPSGRISPLQEKQIATLGDNIHAIEVDGSFDDCQALVKGALADETIRAQRDLTTANSINVGRLLPQAAYYAWAVSKLPGSHVVVPSGNFGNLTAAVYAREMGFPIGKCVAATNANDVVPKFLRSGAFTPRPSVATISNAMDVGDPSNLARLQSLFGQAAAELRRGLSAQSVSEEETRREMKRTYEATGRVLDPHTAVGIAVARKLSDSIPQVAVGAMPNPIIVPATAHPAKFLEVVEDVLGISVPLPVALDEAMRRNKKATRIAAETDALRDIMLGG
jgi:threonine synthase